jgi:hypothetical protein
MNKLYTQTLNNLLNVLCSSGNAFCSGCCKDQVILNEEEEEINPAASSPSSASSKLPFHEDDDIFIDGVVSGRADMTSVSPDT